MERSKNHVGVFKKRVLRIIPSLWVCIIVGVIVAAAFLRICAEQDFCDVVSGPACFYTGFAATGFYK